MNFAMGFLSGVITALFCFILVFKLLSNMKALQEMTPIQAVKVLRKNNKLHKPIVNDEARLVQMEEDEKMGHI